MGTIRRRPTAFDRESRIGTRTTTTNNNMKVIASLLVLLLSCSAAVSAASAHRKLQQTPSANPFPLDFNSAASSFTDEFTDEYNVAKMFQIPDIYGYQDLFEEIFKLGFAFAGAGTQRVYDGPLATASPLAG